MNMIETEIAKTITDICNLMEITSNKYLPKFFFNNNNYYYHSFTIIFSLYPS
jgi:hypothetical protein